MTDLAVMRVHRFGAPERLLAGTLRRVFPQDDILVVADETNGPVSTDDLTKLSLTPPTVAHYVGGTLGRPDWAWRMGDLSLYLALSERPDASRIWLVEGDVFVPREIVTQLFGRLSELNEDVIACNLKRQGDHRFNLGLSGLSAETEFGCIFAFLRASAEAIHESLDLRKRVRAKFGDGLPGVPEPNDEAVLANAAVSAGLTTADLFSVTSEYFDPQDFWMNPPRLFEYHAFTENLQERVVHPVLEFEHILERVQDKATDVRRRNYDLRRLRHVFPHLNRRQRLVLKEAIATASGD